MILTIGTEALPEFCMEDVPMVMFNIGRVGEPAEWAALDCPRKFTAGDATLPAASTQRWPLQINGQWI